MTRPLSPVPEDPQAAAATKPRQWQRWALVAALLLVPILLISTVAGLWSGAEAAQITAAALLLGAVLVVTGWLLIRLARLLLWRVGRRLAFSYFLIGVLPIPMVGLLAVINGYLLAGYFLGHLYRDASADLRSSMQLAAEHELRSPGQDRPDSMVFARYEGGNRISGDDRLPWSWPTWLEQGNEEVDAFDGFIALRDGTPSLLTASGTAERGVLALFVGGLSEALSERSGVWIELYRSDAPEASSVTRLKIAGREFALLPLRSQRSEGRDAFFGIEAETRAKFRDRPFLLWGELVGSVRSIEDGVELSEYVMASLNGTIRVVTRNLFSGSAEVDTAVWAAAISATVVLGAIYALAVLMALFIIFALSGAVNRLSWATEAVRRGDFSARIPVHRRDQIGALQRSFNEMSESLGQMVATEAQQEALQQELRVARDLQQSLLPTNLPDNGNLQFSTLFEPSAAIGGDYFDVLEIDSDHLAVVIADVSGHGLPTGLRMAMLKAALVILIEERKAPEEILGRLDAMVRSDKRVFVTATIGVVDQVRGSLALTNAGHPPTYLVRNRSVEEILLPGNPLGTLGASYGRRTVDLEAGDLVVWLSDGLIEATDAEDRPFGYEGVRAALSEPANSAEELRDALVSAVARHTGGLPADDDRTLVVMRYGGSIAARGDVGAV